MEGTLDAERIVSYDAALAMLSRHNRPTAIICGNDKIALQVFGAAAHLGLSVPDDLSIIGFDDMLVISESLRPALTTVALPYFEIGRQAALMIQSAAEDGPTQRIRVPCPLVERNSCRKLN